MRPLDFEELAPELQMLLAPRVARLGYLGGFFRCAGHQPEALAHFIRYTEALKDALPNELVETVALTAATILGNDYERNQHERLCISLGFGEHWVSCVERAASGGDTSALKSDVAACSAYVKAALSAGDPERALGALVAAVGEADAVGIALTAARYVAHALVVRSFGIEPPVSSIFDQGATDG